MSMVIEAIARGRLDHVVVSGTIVVDGAGELVMTMI